MTQAPTNIVTRGARGESIADIARRTGKYMGINVSPTATDQQVIDSPSPLTGTSPSTSALAGAAGASLLGYSVTESYAAGTVGAAITPFVTLSVLPTIPPVSGACAYVTDTGREGMFKCFPGSVPITDLWQGLYVASNTSGYYWARLRDDPDEVRPEWFGVLSDNGATTVMNSNTVLMAACYAAGRKMKPAARDYYLSTTFKANLAHHSIYGVGKDYTGTTDDMTRILCGNGSDLICQIGADSYPGSVNALPRGIIVKDIHFSRTVAPVIISNAVGVRSQWNLDGIAQNVTSDDSMIGFQENGTVHFTKINCEATRSTAGTGAGTDYFVGHYALGSPDIAAGGNASLRHYDCTAECNYGPLQTAEGSVGFKADGDFTDVWYDNCETTSFQYAQQVLGNSATGATYGNQDFRINHPVHDQFNKAGIYVSGVANSGSVEIEAPYFGPSPGARAAYWVNGSKGVVTLRGGQFCMGAAPSCQPIILSSSACCNVLGYPTILEAGNTYAIVGVGDVTNARIEVFARNYNTTAGAVVQLSGTCTNVEVAPKTAGASGKFSFGIQTLGTGLTNCTFDVSGIESASLPAASYKLYFNGTAITAAGAISGSTTNIGQGNFN